MCFWPEHAINCVSLLCLLALVCSHRQGLFRAGVVQRCWKCVHPGGPVENSDVSYELRGTRVGVCGDDSKTDNRWKHSCEPFIFGLQTVLPVLLCFCFCRILVLIAIHESSIGATDGSVYIYRSVGVHSGGWRLVSPSMPEVTSSTQSCLLPKSVSGSRLW